MLALNQQRSLAASSLRRARMRNGMTFSMSFAFAAIAVIVAVASAPASGHFGDAHGPARVIPGRFVTYTANLEPDQPYGVTFQPTRCVGGNGCFVGLRGTWRTNQSGKLSARFRFPRSFEEGCTAVGCTVHPRFRPGDHVQVQICLTPAATGAKPDLSLACAVKTVVIQ
jgi:hypothetical protein